jgi:Winged helix-turn helix
MKTPIFVRSFSEEEREALQAGLRSKNTFTLRRCQMLLASSRGEYAPRIAESLGCGQQTVRDAIHDFNERGLDALVARSSRPKRTRDAFDEESAEALREMLHRSPREFGYDTRAFGLWRWPHRRASRRGLRRGGSRARPSGPPWRVFSE